MIQEGLYPYKHTDSWEKFKATNLPMKNAFYPKLHIKGINDKDHEHTQQVWNTMGKKTLDAIIIPTWKQMFYYKQVYLRPFKIRA